MRNWRVMADWRRICSRRGKRFSAKGGRFAAREGLGEGIHVLVST